MIWTLFGVRAGSLSLINSERLVADGLDFRDKAPCAHIKKTSGSSSISEVITSAIMHDIKQLKRKTVYENRWMKVHEDDVQFPDGSKGIYGVVDKEDFVLIIPRHRNGHFQLVQQFRYPVEGRYWEFPQGSWETKPGSNPEQVALGELEEETGFKARQLRKLGHLFEAYGFSNQGFHVFLADDLEPGETRRDREEQDMITAAFTRDEIVDMISSGHIKDAPTIAALGLLSISEDQ